MIAGTGQGSLGGAGRHLFYAPRAKKELVKLPKDLQRQITAALDRFAATGYGDVVKITDSKPPVHRLRVGDWRVLLSLTEKAVEVDRIVNRKDAY